MAVCRRDRPLNYHTVVTSARTAPTPVGGGVHIHICIYTYENVCRFGGSLAYTSATASHISFAALLTVRVVLTAADSC